MTLLFDQNLSHLLVAALADVYPGSAHVRDLGLDRSPDADVWDFAKARQFVIVSKDTDFHQRSLLEGAPPKVVWIQRGNCSTAEIAGLLRARTRAMTDFVQDPDAAFLELA